MTPLATPLVVPALGYYDRAQGRFVRHPRRPVGVEWALAPSKTGEQGMSTPQRRTLKDAGYNVEFLKVTELVGVPFVLEGAVMRWDDGNPDQRIGPRWVYDFTARLITGPNRGSSGVVSLSVHDSKGAVIRGRRRLATALVGGVIGPLTMEKGPNQNDFVNFVDFDMADSVYAKALDGLPIVPLGFKKERRENASRQEVREQERTRPPRTRDYVNPRDIEDEDDDLPF